MTIEKIWEYKGLKCAVLFNDYIGIRCGYVGVDEDSKYYGEDGENLSVHGGVTFSGIRDDIHDNLWFIGFDCGHYGDMMYGFKELGGIERDLEFCINECEKLAEQIIQGENNG